MDTEVTNRFGRRGGRGIRPWILLPKIIAVTVYVGTLASVIGIWWGSNFTKLDPVDPKRLWIIEQVGWLIRFVAVPALLAALGLGILLLLQHPRSFIRMRWLMVKLISLAVLIPTAHGYCSSRLELLREAFHGEIRNDSAAGQFWWGLVGALAGSLWIVVLGRLKPRLGQNWARTWQETWPSEREAGK